MKRLLVVAGAAAALALAVVPVQGKVGPDVAVIDSNAVAASVGLTSRVPAESAGGLNWTLTAITLDKALAKAAGGTGGDLAETFFQSSSADYRNPSLIGAQYPPTATIPAEARGGSPEGSPGGVAATHALATEQPSADAEAQGGRGGDGSPMTVQGGTSSSHGELGRDGAVLTKAVAVASGISIGGGAVTIGSATTQAVTTVPPHGPPTTDLKVTLTGVLVGGVPADITDQGLRISDQVPVGPGQLAAFNAALAQLAARGISVTAAPAVREVGANQARAEGGGAVVRYTVTDQIGGDEEVVLAQARSRSTLKLTDVAPELPLPAPNLPAIGTAPPTTPPPSARPAPGPPTAGADSSTTAPNGDALSPLPTTCGPSTVGGTPGSPTAGGPTGTNGSGTAGAPVAAADSGTAAGPAVTACGPTSSGTGAGQVAVGPSTPAHPALNLVGRVDDRALRRLRTGYRVILLLAAAATALHFAAQRSRTS